MSNLPDWRYLTDHDPDGRDRLLIQLCHQGMSASQIAGQFSNVSRNAIIGKVHRLAAKGVAITLSKTGHRGPAKPKAQKVVAKAELTFRATKLFGTTAAAVITDGVDLAIAQAEALIEAHKAPATGFGLAPWVRTSIEPAVKPAPYIARDEAFEPIPGVEPVPKHSPGCKWPVDGREGTGLLACGSSDKLPTEVYCRGHAQLAYNVGAKRGGIPAQRRL